MLLLLVERRRITGMAEYATNAGSQAGCGQQERQHSERKRHDGERPLGKDNLQKLVVHRPDVEEREIGIDGSNGPTGSVDCPGTEVRARK